MEYSGLAEALEHRGLVRRIEMIRSSATARRERQYLAACDHLFVHAIKSGSATLETDLGVFTLTYAAGNEV